MPNSQLKGYLALPQSGKGAGVLVLHPWWGLNTMMKEVCDRLAREGFIAYAPDLYGGRIAETIEEAELLSSELDSKQAEASVASAVDLLWDRISLDDQDQGIGVIGFSLGAYFALGVSIDDPERIRKVVLFYGTGPGDYDRSKAAFLGHFAQIDDYEPVSVVNELEAALRSTGNPVTFYRYPDAGHWFFESDRPDAYNPSAAQLAWERTIAFLAQ